MHILIQYLGVQEVLRIDYWWVTLNVVLYIYSINSMVLLYPEHIQAAQCRFHWSSWRAHMEQSCLAMCWRFAMLVQRSWVALVCHHGHRGSPSMASMPRYTWLRNCIERWKRYRPPHPSGRHLSFDPWKFLLKVWSVSVKGNIARSEHLSFQLL